jgi:exodeoxyribonuclease V beta subunit
MRESYRRQWRREKLAEDLRLLYVALTRSVNKCYLYWGKISNNPNALSFLASQHLKSEDLLSQDKKDYGFDPELEKAFWESQLASHPDIAFETFYRSFPKALETHVERSNLLRRPPSSPHIQQDWMIGSFTALSKSSQQMPYELAEIRIQSDDDEHDGSNIEADQVSGFFNFPRGAVAGTVVHEILETINFQEKASWQKVIEKTLVKYRFIEPTRSSEPNMMVQGCMEMLDKLCASNLLLSQGDSLILSEVPNGSRMDEMEFVYPCQNIEVSALKNLFRKYYANIHQAVDYINDIETLNFKMKSGYLTGFIDCIVEKEGKFFLIDWKSNFLGHNTQFYTPKDLKAQIIHSKYYLQFHIYSLALHLLLKQRLKQDYDYKQHFGGVLYVFVRGVEPGQDTGVYFEKLPIELIEGMSDLMIGDLI